MERDALWQSYGGYTLITGLLSVAFFLLPGPTYYLSPLLILTWLEVLAIQLWAIPDKRLAPPRVSATGPEVGS